MEQSLYTHRSSNIAKTWFLLTVFFGFVLGVGYILAIYLDSPGILFFAAIFSIVSSLGSYWFSDQIALKMAGVEIIERASHKELYDIVDNLAITAGLPTPQIGIINDDALNAFATGRNPHHGVVVFTRGLVAALNREELEGVAAHELSHIVNRDVLVGTVAIILASAIAMVANMMHFGFLGGRDSNRGGGITLVIGLVLMLVAPLLATLLRLAISRKREFLADTSGALLTRKPEALAHALAKIGGSTKPLDRARDATAHLFISNPFGGSMHKISRLFMTHPPIEERIARLRGADRYGEG